MALQQISLDRQVLGGVPYVTGTLVAVATVVSLVAQGFTVAQIVEKHPELTPADVDACVEFQRGGSR